MKSKLSNYLKNYGTNSVFFRNTFLVFMAFIMVLSVPIVISYNLFSKRVKDNAVSANQFESQKLTTAYENIFRDIEYLSASVLSDANVNIFLSATDEMVVETQTVQIRDLLSAYIRGNLNLRSMYIYNRQLDLLYSANGKTESEERALLSWLSGYDTDKYTHNYKIYPIKNKSGIIDSFVFVKKSPVLNGAVMIAVDASKIDKKLSEVIGTGTEFYVLYGNDTVYKSCENELPAAPNTQNGTQVKDGKILTVSESKYYDFNYMVFTASEEYFSQLRYMKFMILWILIVLVVVGVLLAFVLTRNNFGYIMRLIETLDGKHITVKLKDDEIKYITDRIISIIDDNTTLKSQIKKRVTEYEDVKAKALQAQISPHFFNNSLNAINYQLICECGFDTKAALMLSQLSKMIEHSYVTDTVFVTFKEEIEYISMYIAFLKYRYGDFETEINLPKSLEDKKIMKMCIQPFVENSVFHGIKKSGTCIKINCCEDEEYITLSVYDDGEGMSEQNLYELRESLKNDSFSEKNIGISNIYNRLKLIYRDKCDVIIESEQNKYTKITLKFIKEENLTNEKNNVQKNTEQG